MHNPSIAMLVLLCAACGPSRVPDGLGLPNPLSEATTRPGPPAALSGQQGEQRPSMRTTREAVTHDGVAAYALEGRVVDARHESWPEEPVMVRLGVDGARIEQSLKADGRFRFELEGLPRSATIWVHPAYTSRWRWCVPQPFYAQQLTAKQLAGEQELLFEIAQRRRGRVHGVAIDDSSGEPVPGLRFTLTQPWGGSEPDGFEPLEVETDELGRFATRGEIQGGRIELRTRDGDPTPVRKNVDCLIPANSQAEPWVLRFRCGPVIELRLAGEVPRDLSSLKVWFLREGEANALGSTSLHQDAATGRT